MVAKSADGGTTWSETQISTHGSNFNWETHGSRRDGFWGDYIYISAVGGTVMTAWTDSRDLVPGSDPRETGASDDANRCDIASRPRTNRQDGQRIACLSSRADAYMAAANFDWPYGASGSAGWSSGAGMIRPSP